MFLIALWLVLLIPARPAHAQDPERKLGTWTGATSSMKLTPRGSLFLQGELRTWEMLSNVNELLWRIAWIHNFSSKTSGALGYVRVDTWPFDREVEFKFDENRLYQEYLVKMNWGKSKFDHRFRLEQRWLTTVEYGQEFSSRFRYKLGYTLPLGTDKIEKGTYFIKALNEIFLDLDPNDYYYDYESRRVGLNQNRLLLTVGKQLTALSNLRIGFLWQHRPKGDFMRLVVYYSHNFDFTK